MKTSIKVILTVIFVLAFLLSLAGAFICVSSLAFDINNIVQSIEIAYNNPIYLVSNIINIAISLTFALFFLLIAIGCVIGNIYVFVGGNTKKIREIESIIDSAYSSCQENKQE